MRSVLMVAFHFPPLAGSSGIQRTLRFVQQLPAQGWQPVVLSAHPRAYERTSEDLLAELPPGLPVARAQAFDTARHLAVRGRYVGAWARPDRWASWRFDAVRQGLALIRRHRPQAIWSTYPIATAHRIGAELQARSGLPWIADFRDPMAQDGYPEDPQTWQAFAAIEARAARQAAAMVFTTPSSLRLYRERYPQTRAQLALIENGYDEASFAQAESSVPSAPLQAGVTTLLHSGTVYASERDPRALIAGLARLQQHAPSKAARLRLRFRAAGAEALLQQLAEAGGVSALVQCLPPVDYRTALAEMLQADALLILQAANCNAQVPAKLYEYLRAGRPIVCLTDAAGDTAAVLRQAGVQRMAPLDDAEAIAQLLAEIADDAQLQAFRARPDAVRAASREARSAQLAALLAQVSPPSPDLAPHA